jgi:hypothetical protein
MKCDESWKGRVDSAEESDVTIAQRIAAGIMKTIKVGSLEDSWKQTRGAAA